MEKNLKDVEMIPEIAKYLFENGATLIIDNVPPGTDFGIDLKSWKTGDKFKGIKMIPPGIHFIHYSATDAYGDAAPRVGFFHNFHEKEIVVKRWSITDEEVHMEDLDNEIIHRFKDNLRELDRFLGPYPYDISQYWRELTSKINRTIVDRCQPTCRIIRSALELENFDDATRSRSTDPKAVQKPTNRFTVGTKAESLLPNLKPKPGTELRFTPLPERNYPENATPAEITQHCLDSSYTLNLILQKMNDPMEIIGELQFAFICFSIGQSLEAFDHWKKLISLICHTEKLISERLKLFIEFLKTIEIQLSHVSHDILCDIVDSNNLIYQNLRKLFSTIELNTNIDGRLKSESLRMRERLQTKFSWSFSDLLDEDADEKPVVVTMD
ncbi:protein AAR2 homolog [Chelonus insularis]|uniref:protein AAR2 homolog n=1 Tax=Chelonus insularis TaxID=460826 RepID=UPI00158E3DA1|nr:protein AAR2 homolog [Chelonus insularis]